MKVIQSFWSKPFLADTKEETDRFKGGWLSSKFNFYSWALSCLKFKEFYGKVELYTDRFGKELLIDRLNLPYDKVHIVLNDLDNYPSQLWALGKVYTYSLQDEPFLHADSDVFIWERLPEDFTNAQVFSQNEEVNFPRYQEVLEVVKKKFINVPSELTHIYDKTNNILAFNAGIIGGRDVEFFKRYTRKAISFINDNIQNLYLVEGGIFNMLFEQQLGYNVALKDKIPVRFLRHDVNASFTQVMNFHLVPKYESYVHVVGYAKKTIHGCEQVESRLRFEFPEFYQKLNQAIENTPYFNEKSDKFSGLSERRFSYLSKVYNFIENSTWDQLISTKFRLHPKVEVKAEGDGAENNSILTYFMPQSENMEKMDLVGWDSLLVNFQEEKSVAELTQEILQDPDIASSFTKEHLEKKLFSFVMDKAMHTEILIFD
jgi:hypothetical protein